MNQRILSFNWLACYLSRSLSLSSTGALFNSKQAVQTVAFNRALLVNREQANAGRIKCRTVLPAFQTKARSDGKKL